MNSTPALISMFVFFTCLQALNVSCKRSTRNRDKGKVSNMKSVTFRVSGRKLAAPLAALRSAVVGCAAASGGVLAKVSQPCYTLAADNDAPFTISLDSRETVPSL